MTKMSIEEAQANLRELIHKLTPGDEVVITENNLAVARLIGATTAQRERSLASLQGTVTYIASDFDAPLDDFAEYMK